MTACRCAGCNIRLYQHFDRGCCLLVVGTCFFETSVTCCDTAWCNSAFSFLVQLTWMLLPGRICSISSLLTKVLDSSFWNYLYVLCHWDISVGTATSVRAERLLSQEQEIFIFFKTPKTDWVPPTPGPFSGNRGFFHCG